MTLNGVMDVILRYFTAFGRYGANYVKVVESDPYCLQQNCNPKNLLMAVYDFCRYCHRLLRVRNSALQRITLIGRRKFDCTTLRGHLSNS